jgi:hypothetical protein
VDVPAIKGKGCGSWQELSYMRSLVRNKVRFSGVNTILGSEYDFRSTIFGSEYEFWNSKFEIRLSEYIFGSECEVRKSYIQPSTTFTSSGATGCTRNHRKRLRLLATIFTGTKFDTGYDFRVRFSEVSTVFESEDEIQCSDVVYSSQSHSREVELVRLPISASMDPKHFRYRAVDRFTE